MLRTTRTRQDNVASHRLSPDVTAALTPVPHPDKTPARPSSSKKAAATRVSTLLLRQLLIALNLSRIIPLLRTTLADRNTSTNMSPPPRPHCNPRHRSRTPAPRPRNEAPTLSISMDQFRMFGKELALGTATSTL
ncbi:hypothetical protein GWK47_035875 [Chionoecetes opilio]|uniref:Uncharacterized protein n=1 Tax=Chionoecetes opilio TaxID=41210 RepID=A0A8J4YGD4_CHIOP|nr:hypothetical protein GWK47_035875 [Chionoecetes opilio]